MISDCALKFHCRSNPMSDIVHQADHKSGGGGDGFGPYWPQLSSYAGLLAGLYPQHPLQGVAVFWVDHGWLELADEGASAGAFAQARVN